MAAKMVRLENKRKDIKDLGKHIFDGDEYHVILGSSDDRLLTKTEADAIGFHSTYMEIPAGLAKKLQENRAIADYLENGDIEITGGRMTL